MKNRIQYEGRLLNKVIELLENNPKLSITKAVKQMCLEFDIEYQEKIRIGINRALIRQREQKAADEAPEFIKAKSYKSEKGKQTFIITSAQNNTPVHKNFFKNVLAYKEFKNGALHVIASRYKNPTSIWGYRNRDEEKWVSDVVPYLDANRHNIHKYLQILSDVKIPLTASTPLSGLNGITGLETCIVGHPRQHLKSLPVLEGYPHKLLLSTGSCTVSNYTDSKAGKKGEFHHMLGFVIVELDGDDFHIRQVQADKNGNFYDVYWRAEDGDIRPNVEGIVAAVLGDVHVRHNDRQITKVVFDLLRKLKPQHTIVHDIAEMESILHWDEKNPFKLMQKSEEGLDSLEEEIDQIMDWIEEHKEFNLVMARSNHDDMLDRWLTNSDWRKIESKNKKIYLELANVLANERNAQVKGVLPHLIDERFRGDVTTLSLDDSFRILGWELAMHGHLGANGSRGSAGQFKNLNTKNIVGHRHTPHREDGHLAVGTLSHLRVGFNRGPSSWMNGIGVIYPDGKAQLIHFINGKFCRNK